MTKVLISGMISLIISLSSFNVYIAKIFKVKENILVAPADEESMVAEKNFDIDENVTDEIVGNTKPVVEKTKDETIQEKQEEIKQSEVINNVSTQQQNNVKTSSVENKITKTESQTITTQKQETKVENKTTTANTNIATNTNTQKTNTNNTNSSNTNNQTTNNNQQTNTQSVNTQIQVPKQEQQVQQTPQVTQQPQVKQEETKPVQEVVPAQPTREVRRNDEMIQKIKTYISTHESERMKKYGYSFVVDPNVVKRTNAFTFSEFNMQSCLDLTGEIVIYAQDYYCNGQYVETQCFVY